MKKQHLIWSNDIETELGKEKYVRAQWKEELKLNDFTPEEIEKHMADESAYYDWIGDTLQMRLEDERANVPNDDIAYIIKADIGRWNGRYDGGKIIEGIWNTIDTCIYREDYVKIYHDGMQLCIDTSNHDASSFFQIKEITDLGMEMVDKWDGKYFDEEIHNKLWGNTHYTRHVKAFREAYGW